MSVVKPGKKLGQYHVHRRLESGGFADVYEATDTIEERSSPPARRP